MKHIKETYPKPSSPCNFMNIHRASRAVAQFYNQVLKPSGLTIAQMGLLRQIEMAEGKTISEVAKSMRIDRTTLNRNLKPLTEAGLIIIRSGQDSRTRQVTLTAEGSNAAAEAWRLWGEAQVSIKEYLGEEDLAKFTKIMAKLEALAP
ncbi:DNA-binding MarR family transcriptional regulator [Sporomusaceae bacterium BoRhaA]|uniref:MarR family winged helix-turn-helix transcriptional regulator n=1 Tax=Pelorhabdus rhamnosifermentans TaxID=2772457 RepID=UPI001FE87E29|nr:MarR family winged helix-turn-helix transcriptional regulator [Pelorhabdus rhamnosifermentans]MBU2699312.1 DNA-binding MarR family transcriptional regulator [Pelorhabdus rhamnosifermentans]